MSSSTSGQAPPDAPQATPTWTYPTRFCRICREDVAPTVTMYPPGVPPRFQRPIVEYKNNDEYGRLIKPCKCTGSMRYIHELCLLRSRTENRREGSMWKCHTCGYKFNFQKLALQNFLSGKYASGFLTIVFMLVIMFMLGFIADPIINFYVDPYETLMGRQELWDEVVMEAPGRGFISSWVQHLVKGMVSMGLVGFIKTMLLNPLNWLNIRHNLGMTTSTRTTTNGRDRAMNISWIAVLIGVVSAFYFFYQWVQTIIQISLRRIGNNIVDTQLPGDDDDLKPPAGWRAANESTPTTSDRTANASRPSGDLADTYFQKASEFSRRNSIHLPTQPSSSSNGDQDTTGNSQERLDSSYIMVGSWPPNSADAGRSSALDSVQGETWSFASI